MRAVAMTSSTRWRRASSTRPIARQCSQALDRARLYDSEGAATELSPEAGAAGAGGRRRADARELLAEVLRSDGTVVKLAGSVASALACFAEWQPDVLVSDIGMPGEDGPALSGGARR